MISVSQAISTIEDAIAPLGESEIRPLSKSLNYSLYDDLISPIDMPPFRQSAMDGYAINIDDELSYTLIDEIKAGDGHQPVLQKGEAARIFTGAAVPDTANAVIMQEKVQLNERNIILESAPKKDDNIRPLGEQVKKGQVALKAGTNLSTAAIGFLVSLGITEVKVNKKPSVAILVTGNELIEAGQPLPYGKIFESNALMLEATLEKLGYHSVTQYKVEDDYQNTVDILKNVLEEYDLIIISGGISVGDYDFVGKALQALSVRQLFYKVKQKPGKPMFFGRTQDCVIFALPGNPAAALSCFYIYVYKALQILSGHQNFHLPTLKARCRSEFVKRGERAQFLKAKYYGNEVQILSGQNSSMLHTFALANALIYVPEDKETIAPNELVETILLPIN